MSSENLPIGKLLEQLGFISPSQISIALSVQKVTKKKIGEIFLDLDFVTSSEIAEAISMQTKIPFIDLDTFTPSNEALSLISPSLSLKQNILPLYLKDDTLFIAIHEIKDIMTLDAIRKESKKQISFFIADKTKIVKYSQIFYHQLANPIETQINNLISSSFDAIAFVDLLIENAVKDNTTDIHITPENNASHVFFRIDGVLNHMYSFSLEYHPQVVSRIKILSNLDIAESRKPQDGSFSFSFMDNSFDLRVSSVPSLFGENLVLRLLGNNASLFSISKLGFTEKNIALIEKYFSKPYGVILVTGPTGSGKTTTLYSSLRKINSLQKNILTVEDPIEYKFSFVKQTQINVKSGYTFSSALRSFMRQDPDVMLVGEIRDGETAELAIRASITGHLVLSTLHTNDSIGAINRLTDLKIDPVLISSSLLAVIGQRLVRKLCEHCKKPVSITREELLKKGIKEEIINDYLTTTIYTSCGCEQCRFSGFSGRVAIIEIFEVTEDMQSLISENVSTVTLINQAKKNNMYFLRDDGYIKILKGLTTFEELDRVVL